MISPHSYQHLHLRLECPCTHTPTVQHCRAKQFLRVDALQQRCAGTSAIVAPKSIAVDHECQHANEHGAAMNAACGHQHPMHHSLLNERRVLTLELAVHMSLQCPGKEGWTDAIMLSSCAAWASLSSMHPCQPGRQPQTPEQCQPDVLHLLVVLKGAARATLDGVPVPVLPGGHAAWPAVPQCRSQQAGGRRGPAASMLLVKSLLTGFDSTSNVLDGNQRPGCNS